METITAFSFLLLTFFYPLFKISDGLYIPINIVPILLSLLIDKIPVDYSIAKLFKYSFISISILFALTTISSILFSKFNFLNLIYCFTIIYQFLLFINLRKILNNNLTRKLLINFLKIWLTLNLLISLTDVLNIEIFSFLSSYREYLFNIHFSESTNYLSYLDSINLRSPGLVGNSAYYGIVCYLIYKALYFLEADQYKIWQVVALFCILLGGSRTALIIFLFVDFLPIIFSFLNVSSKKTIIYLVAILSSVIFLQDYFRNSLLQNTFETLIGGEVINDFGVAYRLIMFMQLFEEPIYFLFGGYSRNEFGNFVDSEFVMRIKQFGLIGYLSFMNLTFISIKISGFLKSKPLWVATLIASITMFFSSSLFVSPFIAILATSIIHSEESKVKRAITF